MYANIFREDSCGFCGIEVNLRMVTSCVVESYCEADIEEYIVVRIFEGAKSSI